MSSRHGTKFRPSLSCSVCRRRKVKCGKEKPVCGNCLRMNEACEYDREPGAERRTDRALRSDRATIAPLRATESISDQGDNSRELDNSNATRRRTTGWEGESTSQFSVLTPVTNTSTPPSLKRTRSPSGSTPLEDPDLQSNTDIALLWSAGKHGQFNYNDKVRPRYVNNTYWGFVPGQESICDKLLSQERMIPNARGPLLELEGLFRLSMSLPTKPVSDVFFKSFLIGLRPLHSLIYEPALRADYDSLWKWVARKESYIPNTQFIVDPTIMCLMLSVLYCGSLVVPASAWLSPNLQHLDRETTIEHMSELFAKSLSHAQHTRIPTLNTLSALLLARSCAKTTASPLEEIYFVNMVTRMAQSMGLHREDVLSEMKPVPRELSRRIWWHIRSLDVQSSFMTGMTGCCGCSDGLYDTKIILDVAGNQWDRSQGFPPDFRTQYWVEDPVTKLFTIGRYETARFQHSISYVIVDLDHITDAAVATLMDALNKLHLKMDALISQMPADGIPERGMIPSRLANADPSTHERLYIDNSTEPTVFSSWARIVLSVFKAESAILLHKSLLGQGSINEVRWDALIDYCLENLRNFLQLIRTFAFKPYLWFATTRCAPLQAVNLGIIYAQKKPGEEKAKLITYYVDEILDFYSPSDSSQIGIQVSALSIYQKAYQPPAEWNILKSFRAKLNEQPLARQSLDDLATEALASTATAKNGSSPSGSDMMQSSISHLPTPGKDGEDSGEHTEQEMADHWAEQMANNLDAAGHPPNGSCVEGFEQVSEHFFKSINHT